jgi:hypothetical protein
MAIDWRKRVPGFCQSEFWWQLEAKKQLFSYLNSNLLERELDRSDRRRVEIVTDAVLEPFRERSNGARLRPQVVDPLTMLSTLPHNNYDEWVTYIHQNYDHFEVLHSWSKLPFYRRCRRSREILYESTMAGMKNAILSAQSILSPIKPVAATGTGPLSTCLPRTEYA